MKHDSLPLPGKREHSIFFTIFTALIVVLMVEAFLLHGSIQFSKVGEQLRQNAIDILDKQVENRTNYINDQFTQIRELTDISTEINRTTQQLLDDGTLDLNTLD